jgi:hypothetical protein
MFFKNVTHVSGEGLLYLQVPRISIVRFKVAATKLLLSYCQNKCKWLLQEAGCFKKLRYGRKILRDKSIFSEWSVLRNLLKHTFHCRHLPIIYICTCLITYISIIRNDIISWRCISRVFRTLLLTFKISKIRAPTYSFWIFCPLHVMIPQ